ncbi:alternative splicing regulator-domain-containing protein [Cladochytrium replicatum]|nr:alternative splicing regulator-domain-containing protein [Cladochytrium replicatum]
MIKPLALACVVNFNHHKERMAIDLKKRADRRKTYLRNLADPIQLLRVTGTQLHPTPSAEQFYHHENTSHLMKWQGDNETTIDRFDGRALLDYINEHRNDESAVPKEDLEILEDLNFERYKDLVENQRMKIDEETCLTLIDEQWNKSIIKKMPISTLAKGAAIHFDYSWQGSTVECDPESTVQEDRLVEANILDHLDELWEGDIKVLNKMGVPLGISNYYLMLRRLHSESDERAEQRVKTVAAKTGSDDLSASARTRNLNLAQQ